MQTRKLGKHDLKLSILGLGGMALRHRPQDEVDRAVASAVDRGVTYFDVAPSYGNAEELLGPALSPYRDGVTLACKTLERTAAGARQELETSLKRLKTDHFDIYQMHALSKPEDLDAVLADGGALETFLSAKKKGQVKLIGFSAHDEATAVRAIETGHFDTVLFPLNYVIFEHGHFGPNLLDAANRHGVAILAIKAMARAKLVNGANRPYAGCWYQPEDRPDVAELLLRYTLSLPGVVAALPPGDESLCQLAYDLEPKLTPLDDAGRKKLDELLSDEDPLFANPHA